ncbi:MAG: porin family protein [Abditibacteriota bacterium]|nr:porin family protein [Abditibacteriota bacterium]
MKKIVVSIIALALVLSAMAAMAQDKSYTITPKLAYGYVVDGDSRDESGNAMGILVEGQFENIPVGFETGYLFNDKRHSILGVDYKYKGHQLPIMATYNQAFTPDNPFYFKVGAGISINEYKDKVVGAGAIRISERKTRFAFKAGVGYKFADTFCAELTYADYGKCPNFDIKTGQIQLALGYSF